MNYRRHLNSGSNSYRQSGLEWKRRHHLHLIALFAGVTGVAALVGPSDNAEATRSSELSHSVSTQQQLESLPSLLPGAADRSAEALLSAPPVAVQIEPFTTEPPALIEFTAARDPAWQTVKVAKGDTLGQIFSRLGLSTREVHEVVNSGAQAGLLTRLSPGQSIDVRIEGGALVALEYRIDPLRKLSVKRTEKGFGCDLEQREAELRTAYLGGAIEGSFYGTAQQAGLSEALILRIAEVFGWDIDFALDIRKGDRFSVLFEEKYLDGAKIRDGEILAAEFVNQGKVFRAVRFTSPDGRSDYYTPDGHGMRKAFIRSPVDFRRISSTFQTERFHPVLGIKRPHRGVDYSAAVGTPIKAAGDGRVAELGVNSGYGKMIVLDHGRNITTLYGHMSAFGSGLKVGSRVRQGDTIGYVGATGLATGPHLHYEFRLGGVHQNPLTVKLPNAEPIQNAWRPNFEKQTSALFAQLEQQGKVAVATAHGAEAQKN